MAVAARGFSSLASLKTPRLFDVPAAGDGGHWQTPVSKALAAPPSFSLSRNPGNLTVLSGFSGIVTASLTPPTVSVHAFTRDSDFGSGRGSSYESDKDDFSFNDEESISFHDEASFDRGRGLRYNKGRLNRNDGFGRSSGLKGKKLYVGNLPWSADEDRLEDIFQEVGRVELVEVVCDSITKRSRGFAFVTMSSTREAEAAVSRLDGYSLGGREIRVNVASPPRDGSSPRNSRDFTSGNNHANAFGPSQSDDSNKLFVGNLPWGFDDGALENLFSTYGLVEARVVYDRETGRSRGFGYVTVGSLGEANEAILELNGSTVEGRSLRVNLAGERPPRTF